MTKILSQFKKLPEPLKRILISLGLILASPLILLVTLIIILFGKNIPINSIIIRFSNWTSREDKKRLENIRIKGYDDLISIETDWDNKELIASVNCQNLSNDEFDKIKNELLSELDKMEFKIIECKKKIS